MEIHENENKPKITIKDFKNWLEGVIEMQPEGWVPDARQWNRILSKIYEVSDNTTQHSNYNIRYPNYESTFTPPVHIENTPPASLGPYPIAPSGLNNVIPVTSDVVGPFAGENGNIPVKTPNIDSSSGYNSSFA